MTWHGQINRTIWEIEQLLTQQPNNADLKREYLRTHFLQRYEFDRSLHIPRDDRSFLFLQESIAPACLLLHGAHGTPAEMRDFGNYLYGKGLTVFCPRLSRYDLKNRLVSWESWVTMAESALTTVLRYSGRTVIAGLSLGGTVALVLEQLHPVKGVVLLAPAIYPRLGLKGRFYAMARHLSPTLFFKFSGWNGEATRAMEHVRKSNSKIGTPLLVLQARDDHVVSARGLKSLRRWATDDRSEVMLLANGSHALTRGSGREAVFEHVYGFMQKIHIIGSGDEPRRRRHRSR